MDLEPLQRAVGVTHDVCDQECALPGWTQDYRQLAAGAFEGRVTALAAPGVRVFRESTNLRLQQHTAPPPDTVVLGMALAGSAPARFEGRAVGDGELLLFTSPEPSEFLCSGAMDVVAVCIEGWFLREHGLSLPAVAAMTGNAALFSPLAAAFAGWLTRLLGESVSPDRFGLAVWDRCLATLEAMGAGGADTIPSSQRTALVRRARALLRDWPGDPPSVAQLARALGVSSRALEYAFAEVMGVSPNVYLRMIRLNAARRDLTAADPRHTTVAEVAMDHGFWHLGRFSTYYLAMFGEKPSDTLRRAGHGAMK